MQPPQRSVVVAPYDPDWPSLFAAEARAIRTALGDVVAEVHHMGSTAVEGLAAKPVIDVFLQVHRLDGLDARASALEAIGYTPYGEYGLPGRRYFPKGGTVRTHHLHAYAVHNPEPLRHLVFRDYLRAHGPIREAYAALKLRCAAENQANMEGYCDCKNDFIVHHEARALAWAAGRGITQS